ncbi:unnamed protein product [Staurois parvus]|uniref:Uncharacterized protein n=1 Tax=Staurois parvus TaxID=386267 RepID=A0ABN9A8M2_9NEOB|nr:unnamed protein product [Staurois parvus]
MQGSGVHDIQKCSVPECMTYRVQGSGVRANIQSAGFRMRDIQKCSVQECMTQVQSGCRVQECT